MQLISCHTLHSQSLQAVSVEIPVSISLYIFFTGALTFFFFFPFFLTLASAPNKLLFVLRRGGLKRTDVPEQLAACAAALLALARVLQLRTERHCQPV